MVPGWLKWSHIEKRSYAKRAKEATFFLRGKRKDPLKNRSRRRNPAGSFEVVPFSPWWVLLVRKDAQILIENFVL